MKTPGKRFAKAFIRDISNEAFCRIQALDANQLTAVIKCAREMTESNCGWYEYYMKDVIIRMAAEEELEKRIRSKNIKTQAPNI